MERQSGAEFLGDIGEEAKNVRIGLQSGGNVLHVGGTGGDLIWIVDLGPIVVNVENVGRYTNWFSETNHR